jgi:hypothetical protein
MVTLPVTKTAPSAGLGGYRRARGRGVARTPLLPGGDPQQAPPRSRPFARGSRRTRSPAARHFTRQPRLPGCRPASSLMSLTDSGPRQRRPVSPRRYSLAPHRLRRSCPARRRHQLSSARRPHTGHLDRPAPRKSTSLPADHPHHRRLRAPPGAPTKRVSAPAHALTHASRPISEPRPVAPQPGGAACCLYTDRRSGHQDVAQDHRITGRPCRRDPDRPEPAV